MKVNLKLVFVAIATTLYGCGPEAVDQRSAESQSGVDTAHLSISDGPDDSMGAGSGAWEDSSEEEPSPSPNPLEGRSSFGSSAFPNYDYPGSEAWEDNSEDYSEEEPSPSPNPLEGRSSFGSSAFPNYDYPGSEAWEDYSEEEPSPTVAQLIINEVPAVVSSEQNFEAVSEVVVVDENDQSQVSMVALPQSKKCEEEKAKVAAALDEKRAEIQALGMLWYRYKDADPSEAQKHWQAAVEATQEFHSITNKLYVECQGGDYNDETDEAMARLWEAENTERLRINGGILDQFHLEATKKRIKEHEDRRKDEEQQAHQSQPIPTSNPLEGRSSFGSSAFPNYDYPGSEAWED